MKFIRYSKFKGFDVFGLDLGSLMDALSEQMLDSGFNEDYWWTRQRQEPDDSLDALRQAILQALLDEEVLSAQDVQQMLSDNGGKFRGSLLEELINQLIERLVEEGYLNLKEVPSEQRQDVQNGNGNGEIGEPMPRNIKFEVTEKGLDFLGYKTLRDLLGSLGKSNFGRHETRHWATGVEAHGASQHYEFGDTLNLDTVTTLKSAIAREGIGLPLNLEYDDLHVHQCEYQSSCATVVMLDCSHSMILYGEDRFTPAKKVAMALSHLIRTQYPGDSLSLVLFHDSAEELPVSQLARVKVGPYYTNTREGLRVAQRILARQRKDMKQIVMITDGKPSALSEADGRIYRNPFGLDPRVVALTLKEVASCRRQGILINTFMLARDWELVAFVKRITEMCRGKAFFTTPYTLGQFVLMDFLNKKTRMVH